MIVGVLIIVFALIVTAIGRPVEGAEDLYYDVDFNALYDKDSSEEEEGAEQPVKKSVKPKVAQDGSSVKIQTSEGQSSVDAKAEAEKIYSEIDM